MTRLLLIINETPVSIWQGFKELCYVNNLPYHSIKNKPFPRSCEIDGINYKIEKLPFRLK